MDAELTPNQSAFPSAPWNSPQAASLLAFAGALAPDFGAVRPEVGVAAPDGSVNITPQGATNDLMALRAQFPFLPILPFPPQSWAKYLAANTAVECNIPDGCVLMLLRGNNDFYISIQGNAQVPDATNTSDSLGDSSNKSFYAPQGILLYCGGMQRFSVIAPNAGTIVSAVFFAPRQYPR